MKKILGLAFMLIGINLVVLAQKKDETFNPTDLKLDWKLITNNYNGKDQYSFSLSFTNTSKKTSTPATGWTIYYNANRDLAYKNLDDQFESFRYHGDLFYLKPTSNFKGLKPGESLTVNGIGDSWVFNISDAPSGYYWVWEQDSKKTFAITKTTASSPDNIDQFKLKPNQKNDQITPEMVFEQNTGIKDIPENQLPKIFPTPKMASFKPGYFTLTQPIKIYTENGFSTEATYVQNELKHFTGKTAEMGSISASSLHLKADPTLPSEAYRLNVSEQGIVISASSAAGMFYGIQSLKSLFPLDSWKTPTAALQVPFADVMDAPRFGYRGLHVDVARNFQTKEQVKRILNWMAMYKLNKMHFHFSEDDAWRIEIPELPELTTVGVIRGHTLDSKDHMPSAYGSGGDINNVQSSFYTRNEYIEILKHAKALHIEVIPEIETPGHARAAIKAMDARYTRLMNEGKPEEAKKYLLSDANDQSVYLSAQNFKDNIMCIALPSVYTFLETAVDALMKMHEEAGMPLKTIHMGGDEVPQGVWEKSPLAQNLLQQLPKEKFKQTSDLWIYYWEKVTDILKKRNLYVSGWEEIGMRESRVDGNRVMMVNPEFANNNFHTYVWNTVIGWGAEDLPYRLANGGYKVILCPVSNLYFDLAYQKDFNEVGYYWGGFVDVDKSFYFIPYDYLKNTKVDRFGNEIDPSVLSGKDKLTDYGKSNILGIQGELWSENIRSANDLEYLAFPKMLGLVERAWAQDPEWATTKDPKKANELYQDAWSIFTNTIAKKELYKLNYFQGGANFRIPSVGAKTISGKVHANIQLPGMIIRYTLDGSEPNNNSMMYKEPISEKGNIRLRAFDSKGRGSRTIEIKNN